MRWNDRGRLDSIGAHLFFNLREIDECLIALTTLVNRPSFARSEVFVVHVTMNGVIGACIGKTVNDGVVLVGELAADAKLTFSICTKE